MNPLFLAGLAYDPMTDPAIRAEFPDGKPYVAARFGVRRPGDPLTAERVITAQWDVGSPVSVVNQDFATTYGFTLDDGRRIPLTGSAGGRELAYVTRHWVRLFDYADGLRPGADGRYRPDDPGGISGYEFRLDFLVKPTSTLKRPLLGLRPVHDWFEVRQQADDYHFVLRQVPPGGVLMGPDGEPLIRCVAG